MERLPFDPGKMAAAKRTKPEDSGEAPLRVSQLAQRIDGALKQGVPGSVRVIGEVSGFRHRTHWYFDLKDADALIGCVVFASSLRRLSFTPENGHEVVVSGRVEFWAPGGRTSLIATRVEPVGAGALELAFRKLCEELRSAGYFELGRKRALPAYPRRIAVVTSAGGAALQDVLDTARRRQPGVEWLVVDARVQGERAAGEVAAAVRMLSARREELGLDAVLLTRGGGSMEDLWAFNEREVADAVFACQVPVVAAIGHETDTTVVELVADERAATPTQAAMRLVPDRSAVLEQLDALSGRMRFGLERRLSVATQRVRAAARTPVLADPMQQVRSKRRDADSAARALRSALRERLASDERRVQRAALAIERTRPVAVHARQAARIGSVRLRLVHALRSRLDPHRLDRLSHELARAGRVAIEQRARDALALERELEALDPRAVLGRGYSITRDSEGNLVRRAEQVRPGETITTQLGEGSLRSVAGEGGSEEAGAFGGTRARARVRRGRSRSRADGDADQMDLFGGG